MRSAAVAALLCFCTSALAAKARDPKVKVGDTCVMKKKLKATAGKKPIVVPAGHSVNITGFEKSFVVFTTAGKTARASRKLLEHLCLATSAPTVADAEPKSESLAAATAPPTVAKDSEPALAAPAPEPAPELATPPPAPAPVVAEKPPAPEPVRTDVSANVARPPPRPDDKLQSLGWAFTGVGIVSIAGGGACYVIGYFQATSLNKRALAYDAAPVRPIAEYNSINRGRSEVQVLDIAAYVAGGVGVAALATGIGLLIASHSRKHAEVTLVPNPGGISLLATF